MKPVLQVNVSKIPSGSWFDALHDEFIVVQADAKSEPPFKIIPSDQDRREELAARFAVAIVSNPNVVGGEHGYDFVADRACKYADALIKELDK